MSGDNQNVTASIGPPSAPVIQSVALDAPWNWLAAGWEDLWSAPHISLTYGAAFTAAAYILAACLFQTGALPFLLPLAGGFLLVGPLLAVGLYEVSREREAGRQPTFAAVIRAGASVRGQLALFGLVLLIINFAWLLTAFLLFMLFFGPAKFPPPEALVPALLFTQHGLGLLATGTAAGAVLAAITYSVSVISVPMLLDRKMDAVTAAILSVQAVFRNLPAMALWAALILVLSATGIATLFIGLAVTFPLIGHATWHAYRELTAEAAPYSPSNSEVDK